MYFRQQEKQCDFVLKLNKGQYDVGFEKQKDGSYLPIFDEHANYVGSQLANKDKACPVPRTSEERAMAQLGMLSQEYGRQAAINAAIAQGFNVVETNECDEHGNMVLAFER